MDRKEALALVNDWTKNKNLVKHMLAVEAEMRALARHFGEDEDIWGVTGLVHDADYEMFADEPKKHPSKIFEELENRGADQKIIDCIKAHGWQHSEIFKEPETKMDWALYTCDDLSGMIIACALVRPDKKLSSVTVKSILKKFPTKAFAKGVNRDQIKLCEEKLGIPLEEFLQINLEALQGISEELGL